MGEQFYFRPYVSAGLNAASQKNWKISAAFEGAPDTSMFSVTTPMRNVSGQFAGGFSLLSADGVELRLEGQDRIASHYSAWNGSAKIDVKF